jgi:HEAT repeat protein
MGPRAAVAVPPLTALLRHQNPYLRKVAASALGRMGPAARPALPALRAALKDEELDVRKEAAEALQQLERRAERGK